MKISAQFGMWSSLVFALFCLYIAFDGFVSIASLTDETQRADSRGFAYFWLFLGMVSVGCALLSRWIVKREEANPSDG
jgi:hypothetical protein